MSRRHQRRVTMRHHTLRMRNGSTIAWIEYPYGNRRDSRFQASAGVERLFWNRAFRGLRTARAKP